eukprot:2806165-Pyramimonas_sp.AAC.1
MTDWKQRKHQDLWDQIWAAIAELGGVDPRTVTSSKMKDHATRVERDRIGRARWEGNRSSDKIAKPGAMYHTHPA